MNGPLSRVIILPALAILCAGASAQQQPAAEAEGGAQALTQAGVATSPAQTWRDARILFMVSRIGLDVNQGGQMVPYLAQLQQQLETGKQARTQIWQQSGTAIQSVIADWIAALEPGEAEVAAADRAANDLRAQEALENTAISSTASIAIQLLTAEQKELVETTEEAGLRMRASLRYDGAPSLADHVIRQIMAQRYLMPDEYVLVRISEAANVAELIVSRRSDRYARTEEAALQLFDQVSNWSDEELSAQLPALAQSIRDFLALTEQPPKPIDYDTLRDWIKDPRTAGYLGILGTAGEPIPIEEPPAQDPLEAAVAAADVVSLLNSLALDNRQLANLQLVAEAAKADADDAAAAKDALLTEAAPQLTQVIPYLMGASPLSDEWKMYLADIQAGLDEQDDLLSVAMVNLVAATARIMAPDQAAYVDWRVPPPIVGLQSTETLGGLKQEEAAMIRDAVALIDFLKPLTLDLFLRMRIVRIEEFLSQYMHPDDPQFERTRDDIAEQITDVRGIPRDEWAGIAPAVGVEILQTAGQLLRPTWKASDKPLDWYAIRDILLAPGIEATLQSMITARQGG